MTGRFLLAVLAVWIVGRRRLLRLFQLPGLILVPLVYFFPARENLDLLKWGIFLAGLLTIARVFLLGRLSASRLSAPSARYGRELCRQHRRPHAGNVGRAPDHLAHHTAAQQVLGRGSRPGGSACVWSRLAPLLLAAGAQVGAADGVSQRLGQLIAHGIDLSRVKVYLQAPGKIVKKLVYLRARGDRRWRTIRADCAARAPSHRAWAATAVGR